MPGSSLWLLPPANSPLDAILSAQIDTVSKHFHSEHRFLPHVTLTSGISESTYTPDPQAWLNNLSLPSDVRVKFEKVASEDAFVKKLYINVVKDDSVRELGEAARRTVEDGERAKAWAKDEYLPHLSLMYKEGPKISSEGIDWTEKTLRVAGLTLDDEPGYDGWSGGRVVLVPTDRPVKDWAPIAERAL